MHEALWEEGQFRKKFYSGQPIFTRFLCAPRVCATLDRWTGTILSSLSWRTDN